MFEAIESLLPTKTDRKPLRSLMVGFDEIDLEELARLLSTLGVEVAGNEVMKIRKIHPATYIGTGRLEGIKERAKEEKIDLVVIDRDLSPNQLRNLEKIVCVSVIDRPGVILEIFSRNAKTKESKTQVELAKLTYLLPRLAHYWSHFERQRGGIGMKGMGEKQLEVDRRLLKKRIVSLKGRLKEIEKNRKVQRSGREDLLKVALVGYTNAGKSTLLNAMTYSDVLAEDRLFATLDSSIRALNPDHHPPIVAIDTVGSITRIPTSLIASFRSTLEELQLADLLLHVVDGSSARAKEEYETTEEILEELELTDKPRLVVMNKVDLIQERGRKNLLKTWVPGALQVSALSKEDVAVVRERIFQILKQTLELVDVVIPYSESKLEAMIRNHGRVEKMKHLEQGTFFRVRIADIWVQKLNLERFRT